MIKRLIGVPNRRYDVILHRDNPTELQSEEVVVASFDDEQRAQGEAGRREGDGKGEYFVSPNINARPQSRRGPAPKSAEELKSRHVLYCTDAEWRKFIAPAIENMAGSRQG